MKFPTVIFKSIRIVALVSWCFRYYWKKKIWSIFYVHYQVDGDSMLNTQQTSRCKRDYKSPTFRSFGKTETINATWTAKKKFSLLQMKMAKILHGKWVDYVKFYWISFENIYQWMLLNWYEFCIIKGDHGTGLTCNGVLTGIFRSAINCKRPNGDNHYVGYYLNVYRYREWILWNSSRALQPKMCLVLFVMFTCISTYILK